MRIKKACSMAGFSELLGIPRPTGDLLPGGTITLHVAVPLI